MREHFEEQAFWQVVNQVSLSLMEDQDQFYGYFLFQMGRMIDWELESATGVTFKGGKYVIYFNPSIFLTLTRGQMASSIKHEIHHVLALHLYRSKALEGKYDRVVMNIAMDLVVNQYLDHLPPYAVTLEWVHMKYGCKLKPYEAFEYYLEQLQIVYDMGEIDESQDRDEEQEEMVRTPEFNPETTHALWEAAEEVSLNTLQTFAEQVARQAIKGKLSEHLEGMMGILKGQKAELPWQLYLSRLMGTVESNKKKTMTRRNRRQPERMDLRGTLRSHKAEIAVAIDSSGSISDEAFEQAMKEVLDIVKNHNREITVIECDQEIRATYKVKRTSDLRSRTGIQGGTQFSPVFEYANKHKVNLLIYFTDGKGESQPCVKPRGYPILWVIAGDGEGLSLQNAYGTIKKLSQVKCDERTIAMQDVRHDGYSMNHQEPLGI
ncbi:MAG: vWA domain-containing protein [Cellulosilyticaceae bacterium]